MLVRNACARGMDDEIAAAYDAPYPTAESKAGARAFPLMLPITPDMPGAAAGKRVLEALRSDQRPAEMLAELRPGAALQGRGGVCRPDRCGELVPHFLQEDAARSRLIADWLA